MSAAAVNSTAADVNANWSPMRSTAAAAVSIRRSSCSVMAISAELLHTPVRGPARWHRSWPIGRSTGRPPRGRRAERRCAGRIRRGVAGPQGPRPLPATATSAAVGLDVSGRTRLGGFVAPGPRRRRQPLCGMSISASSCSRELWAVAAAALVAAAAAAISSASRAWPVSSSIFSAASCAAASRGPAAMRCWDSSATCSVRTACRHTRSSTSATAAAHSATAASASGQPGDCRGPFARGTPGGGEVAAIFRVDAFDEQRLVAGQRPGVAGRHVERARQRVTA